MLSKFSLLLCRLIADIYQLTITKLSGPFLKTDPGKVILGFFFICYIVDLASRNLSIYLSIYLSNLLLRLNPRGGRQTSFDKPCTEGGS